MASTIAAVWRGGSDVSLESVPLPTLAMGEVLVRVRLATVCGSDLHTVSGRRPGACPSVLGHEAVGDVVAAGAESPVDLGDRVVWGVTVACGHCDRCLAGRTAKCRAVRKFGHESFDSRWPLSGAYAHHVMLPRGATIARVPAGVSDEQAAPAACATATVMAAMSAAGNVRNTRVLVTGVGMLGLTAVAAAAHAGASEIVVSDPDLKRLSCATSFGATSTVLPGQHSSVDVAFEFSGASGAVSAAFDSLDVGGRLVLAGSVSPGAPVQLDPERVVRHWLTVTGVHNYEPHHLTQALELLSATRHLPWSQLVAAPAPLTQLARLLADSDRRRPRTSVAPTPP